MNEIPPGSAPKEESYEDELERITNELLEKNKDNIAYDRAFAREVAAISIRGRKLKEKEMKRYPGGKDYEGRPTD